MSWAEFITASYMDCGDRSAVRRWPKCVVEVTVWMVKSGGVGGGLQGNTMEAGDPESGRGWWNHSHGGKMGAEMLFASDTVEPRANTSVFDTFNSMPIRSKAIQASCINSSTCSGVCMTATRSSTNATGVHLDNDRRKQS